MKGRNFCLIPLSSCSPAPLLPCSLLPCSPAPLLPCSSAPLLPCSSAPLFLKSNPTGGAPPATNVRNTTSYLLPWSLGALFTPTSGASYLLRSLLPPARVFLESRPTGGAPPATNGSPQAQILFPPASCLLPPALFLELRSCTST